MRNTKRMGCTPKNVPLRAEPGRDGSDSRPFLHGKGFRDREPPTPERPFQQSLREAEFRAVRGKIIQTILRTLDNRLRGAMTTANRGADSFAEISRRKALPSRR